MKLWLRFWNVSFTCMIILFHRTNILSRFHKWIFMFRIVTVMQIQLLLYGKWKIQSVGRQNSYIVLLHRPTVVWLFLREGTFFLSWRIFEYKWHWYFGVTNWQIRIWFLLCTLAKSPFICLEQVITSLHDFHLPELWNFLLLLWMVSPLCSKVKIIPVMNNLAF